MEEQNNFSSQFPSETDSIPTSAPTPTPTPLYQEAPTEKKTPVGIVAFIAILMFCLGCASMYLLITFSVIKPQQYGKKDTTTSTSTTKISEKEDSVSNTDPVENKVDKTTESEPSTTVNTNLITKAVNSCKFSFNYEKNAFKTFYEGNNAKYFDNATVAEGQVLSGTENSGDVTKLVYVSCSKTSNTENTYANRRKVLDTLGELRTGATANPQIKEIAREKKIGENTYLVVDYSFVTPMDPEATNERLYTIVTPSYQYVINVLPASNSDAILEEAGLKFFN